MVQNLKTHNQITSSKNNGKQMVTQKKKPTQGLALISKHQAASERLHKEA